MSPDQLDTYDAMCAKSRRTTVTNIAYTSPIEYARRILDRHPELGVDGEMLALQLDMIEDALVRHEPPVVQVNVEQEG